MARFSGSGRLFLDGGNYQQASDLEFWADCELAIAGSRQAIIENIRRFNGSARVVDVTGAENLILSSVKGAVRVTGGTDLQISDVLGDLFADSPQNVDVKGLVGTAHFTGAANVHVQARGYVQFEGGNNCRADVDGTVEIDGGANMKIALRSVEEEKGLVVNGGSRIDADVLI